MLTACLYHEDKAVKQNPNETMIAHVQQAVDRYREDNHGLLPLKNKNSNVDIYNKYLIDFGRLVPNYLPEIPENAFEKGGIFQYVIVNPEEAPTVKIFDLRIAEKIREINMRISTKKYPPFKEKIDHNVFTLDFHQLGYDEPPTIVSPFTGQNLSFVITGSGQVYVDYQSDLYLMMKDLHEIPFQPGDDIRSLLIEESFFVPAYSLPYTIDENGEPAFMNKN